jgi:Fur family ferric uptake transcriptional regulator
LNEVLINNTDRNIELGKERLLIALRSKGIKLTKQRKLVIDIILEKEVHSCKDIYEYASRIDHNIGVATVYRMVKTLEKEGIVNRKINVTIGA